MDRFHRLAMLRYVGGKYPEAIEMKCTDDEIR